MKLLIEDYPLRPPKDILLHNKIDQFETEEQRIWWDALVRLSDFISLTMQDAIERTTGKYRPMLFTEFLERIYYVLASSRVCGQGFAFDDFVQIARFSIPAIKHIVSSPSKQIVKLQEKVHVSKIRETGSKTMQWMSKRPGRSVQEKIAPENKVMTNVTHFSTDTKENRETVYLYNILYDIIRERLKENNCLTCSHSKACEIPIDALRDVMALHNKIRTGDLSEVKAIKQTLQNNKLMCDKYYKMVWDAVQRLSRIEEKLDNDWEHLYDRYTQLGFWIVASIILHETESQIIDYYGELTDKDGFLNFSILANETKTEEKIVSNDICFYPTFHSWEPFAIYLRDDMICLFDVNKNVEVNHFDIGHIINQYIGAACDIDYTNPLSQERGAEIPTVPEAKPEKDPNVDYKSDIAILSESELLSSLNVDSLSEELLNEKTTGEESPAESTFEVDKVLIEDMGLSVRSYNSLRRGGYKVSGEFIYLPDKELLKIRNLGQKGVDEIHSWMRKNEQVTSVSVIQAAPIPNKPVQIEKAESSILPISRTGRCININAVLEEIGAQKVDLGDIQIGDTVLFGSYWIEDKKKDDIEWIVLDKKENAVMLISMYALAAMPFTFDENRYTHWPRSSIRSWLNDQFIAEAFTNQQSLHILTTKVSNLQTDGYPESAVGDCKSTKDKVFLLSYKEATGYFSTDENRIAEATPYAEAMLFAQKRSNKASWTLRSNWSNMAVVSVVSENGVIAGSGTRTTRLIRPAMWINTTFEKEKFDTDAFDADMEFEIINGLNE